MNILVTDGEGDFESFTKFYAKELRRIDRGINVKTLLGYHMRMKFLKLGILELNYSHYYKRYRVSEKAKKIIYSNETKEKESEEE